MRKLRKIHDVISTNLECKGNPDMFVCRHDETWSKTWDNRDNSIGSARDIGVDFYEKA